MKKLVFFFHLALNVPYKNSSQILRCIKKNKLCIQKKARMKDTQLLR